MAVEYDFGFTDTNYPSYKNTHRNYDHNLFVGYAVNSKWTPYVEVGYIPYKPSGEVYGVITSYSIHYTKLYESICNQFALFISDLDLTLVKLIHSLFLMPIFQKVPRRRAFLIALPNNKR